MKSVSNMAIMELMAPLCGSADQGAAAQAMSLWKASNVYCPAATEALMAGMSISVQAEIPALAEPSRAANMEAMPALAIRPEGVVCIR